MIDQSLPCIADTEAARRENARPVHAVRPAGLDDLLAALPGPQG